MKCADCGGTKFKDVRHQVEQRVAGVRFSVDTRARKCGQCGELYFTCAALEDAELGMAAELARRGVRNGESFRFMRKALGMRAADIAELLDVSADTVSRWERGAAVVDHSAFAVLGALAAERREGRADMLERLKAVRDPQVPTVPVRVVAA